MLSEADLVVGKWTRDKQGFIYQIIKETKWFSTIKVYTIIGDSGRLVSLLPTEFKDFEPYEC